MGVAQFASLEGSGSCFCILILLQPQVGSMSNLNDVMVQFWEALLVDGY